MAEPTSATTDQCKVCGGSLAPDVTKEFDATLGPAIIGPGSRSQYRNVTHGYYCTVCGLKYKFPPGKPPPPPPPEKDESLRFPWEY